MSKWIKYRFKSSEVEDYRPLISPPPGPWWCTGSSCDMDDDAYVIIVAYLPPDADLADYWPEAYDVEEQPCEEIVYTSRFPKPSWWKDE